MLCFLLVISISTHSWGMLDTEAGIIRNEVTDVQGFDLSPEVRAQADMKFTYVLTCQIYGKQKEGHKPEAEDIALLMQRFYNIYWLHCIPFPTYFSISN